MKIRILIFSLIVLPIIALGQVTSQQTSYNYQLAHCVGTKNSTAWIGQNVVVMIEGETPSDRDPAIMATIVQTFGNIISKFEEITGLNNLPHNSSFNNKPVIEVVLDNCGAGGLAGHGAIGMSTGKYYLDRFYNFVQQGNVTVPQIFFYELNRNFWLPSFNNKFDWAMNNNASNWGWWTVGMNNAQAYIMPKLLNIGMDYVGSDVNAWRTRMVGELNSYMNNTTYNFDNGWRQDRMPWKNTESINDLMSGFFIYSYDNFGGEAWIKNFYKYIQDPSIPNRSGYFAYQECRDNVYRIWNASSQQDLTSFFENDLRWIISPSVKTSCVDNNVSLTLVTDNYGSETSWTLKNSSGATVQSGNGYSNNKTYTFNWNLPADSYTFTINDSYGDGICCAYGNGSYTLTAGSTTIKSGGSFTNAETTDFCTKAPPCVSNNVSLTLVTDNYGSETSWTLKNSNGATVHSGNGYSNAQTYTFNWNLPAGNYTFTINDSYGDGICCAHGNGSYTLTAGSATIKSGGSFTNAETTDFCTTPNPPSMLFNSGASNQLEATTIGTAYEQVATATEPNKQVTTVGAGDKQKKTAIELMVYPNPTNSQLNVQLDQIQEGTTATIIDATGRLVWSSEITTTLTQINTQAFTAGVYNLTIITPNGKSSTKRFVKIK